MENGLPLEHEGNQTRQLKYKNGQQIENNNIAKKKKEM